jgi:hypothetical protein
MPSSFLLRLPREVRDIIYDYYVYSEDGYVYDFRTNKLRLANGNTISISLGFTCRQLAHELSGLALERNTIMFSTFFSEDTSRSAGLLHLVTAHTRRAREMLVDELAPILLTPRMAHAASEKYPALTPLINTWFQHKKLYLCAKNLYGVAPSLGPNSFVPC